MYRLECTGNYLSVKDCFCSYLNVQELRRSGEEKEGIRKEEDGYFQPIHLPDDMSLGTDWVCCTFRSWCCFRLQCNCYLPLSLYFTISYLYSVTTLKYWQYYLKMWCRLYCSKFISFNWNKIISLYFFHFLSFDNWKRFVIRPPN